MYEALRAFFLENRPSHEVARDFGYSAGSFRVLCHAFRRDPDPQFFASPTPGPREQPRKSKAHDLIITLRKQNHSVYEIAEVLKERKMPLSPTAIREVLRAEGFAPLPRRLDEERSATGPAASVEPVADARTFTLAPGRQFTTSCGGLFLFLPDLVRLGVDDLAGATKLPGSAMIPAEHALRAALALKLWSIERKSHVMALVADPGLALFCGLNAIPKKSYLSEYSARVNHAKTTSLLAAWHGAVAQDKLFAGASFNLDFHSVPYYGEDSQVENHYVSMRSRAQPAVLAFLAQDADGRAFCYSNADLRKGEEAEEIFHFVEFWKKHHGENPRHLVFDSRLTTYANLTRLDELGITFITLRRRSASLLSQLFILDLGHEDPTILLTNDRQTTHAKLITRYAQRMLIENALSDAVRFFHMDALSSAVGLKVDFDMALLVIASGLYRLFARRMRGYADAQARQIFRDLVDTPADVTISESEVHVRFHRRAHLPIIGASGLLDSPVKVPWWSQRALRMSA
jgi:hypothetical protein